MNKTQRKEYIKLLGIYVEVVRQCEELLDQKDEMRDDLKQVIKENLRNIEVTTETLKRGL